MSGQRAGFSMRSICAARFYQPLRMLALFFAEIGAEFFDVVAEFRGEFHAGAADFFNERVAVCFHVSPFISCKGVIKSGTARCRR